MGYSVERMGIQGRQLLKVTMATRQRPGRKEPANHGRKWISHSSQNGWLNEVVINMEQLVRLASI